MTTVGGETSSRPANRYAVRTHRPNNRSTSQPSSPNPADGSGRDEADRVGGCSCGLVLPMGCCGAYCGEGGGKGGCCGIGSARRFRSVGAMIVEEIWGR